MKFLFFFSVIFSMNAFASNAMFSELECKGNGSTLLNIKLNKSVSAVNDSGLDLSLEDVDLKVTYFNEVGEVSSVVLIPDVSLLQATKHFNYQLSLSSQLLRGSAYNSFLTIHPEFKETRLGKILLGYKGEVEINGVVDGSDYMLIKSNELDCKAVR